MLQSGLYHKKLFKTQNPWLINKSSFKSRAAFNGARAVVYDLEKTQKYKKMGLFAIFNYKIFYFPHNSISGLSVVFFTLNYTLLCQAFAL